MIMGIFTSRDKSLQELPKPFSLDIDAIKGSEIGSVDNVNTNFEMPQSQVSEPRVKKKVFIKMDHYKEAVETIDKIKEKIRDTERLISEMKRMKTQEDECLVKWNSDMEGIKRKLSKMDEILYDMENE